MPNFLLYGASGFVGSAVALLAAHLKQRLPSATRLTLAFYPQGPAGLPPGTANTMVEGLSVPPQVRRNGKLEPAPSDAPARAFDFGEGPVEARLLNWGDLFMAYHSTGIPNIEDYAAFPPRLFESVERIRRFLGPVLDFSLVQSGLKASFRA